MKPRLIVLGVVCGAIAAGVVFIVRRPDLPPRGETDVAPLRAALERSAQTALPDPTLSGVKFDLKSRDVEKTAAELVAAAGDLGGSAFSTEEAVGTRVVTANIPRAKAVDFAARAGGEYKLSGAAEDMITFDLTIAPTRP